jgi:hypothetical protein
MAHAAQRVDEYRTPTGWRPFVWSPHPTPHPIARSNHLPPRLLKF